MFDQPQQLSKPYTRAADLMLFQDTPFFPFSWLGSLFVVAPLNSIAHGGHGAEFAAGLKAKDLVSEFKDRDAGVILPRPRSIMIQLFRFQIVKAIDSSFNGTRRLRA